MKIRAKWYTNSASDVEHWELWSDFGIWIPKTGSRGVPKEIYFNIDTIHRVDFNDYGDPDNVFIHITKRGVLIKDTFIPMTNIRSIEYEEIK